MPVTIEDALDDCLVRIAHEGLDACLARYPQHRAALEPLLRVAGGMQRTVNAAAPRDAARLAIRQRVLAAAVRQAPAGTSGTPAPAVPAQSPSLVVVPGGQREAPKRRTIPRIWQAAAAVILLLGGLGVAWPVAAASLPGDPLYGAKLASESLTLAVAGSPAAVARAHFDFAERRASEVQILARQGRVTQAASALDNMAAHTDAGLALMSQVPLEGTSPLLEHLVRVTSSESAALVAVTPGGSQSPSLAGSEAYQRAGTSLTASRQLLELLGAPVPPALPASVPVPTLDTEEETDLPQPTHRPTAIILPSATTPPAVTRVPATIAAPTETRVSPGQQRTPGPRVTPPGQQRTPLPRITPPGARTPGPRTPGPRITPPGQQRTPAPRVTPPGPRVTPPGQPPTAAPQVTPPAPQITLVPPSTPAGKKPTSEPRATPPDQEPPSRPKPTRDPEKTPPGHGGSGVPEDTGTPPAGGGAGHGGDPTPGPLVTPPTQEETPGPQVTPPGPPSGGGGPNPQVTPRDPPGGGRDPGEDGGNGRQPEDAPTPTTPDPPVPPDVNPGGHGDRRP
ncbi:MAG TPA: DUF5667 domain-containing protein [Chloroflexia bacterium]|nr:DUF5667 domain-containing protein [Chloroflexia bacterium]